MGEDKGSVVDEIRANARELWIKGKSAVTMLVVVAVTIVVVYGIYSLRLFLVEDSAAAVTIRAINDRLPQSKAEHDAILDELQVQSYILAECMRNNGQCPRLRPPRALDDRIIP